LNELFVVHPSLQNIIYDFFNNYINFRLIDIEKMTKALPLTIDEFFNYIKSDVDEHNQYLLSNWYQECIGFISAFKDDIENLMPNDTEVTK